MSDVKRVGPRNFRCAVCGGPRIPLSAASPALDQRSELESLRVAYREGRRAWFYRLASYAALAVALPALFVTSGLWFLISPGAIIGTLLGVAALTPWVLTYGLWHSARQARRKAEDSEAEAWRRATEDMLRGRSLEASELAEVLHVGEPQAEQLLAELNASDAIASRVTEDGRVLYSGAPRMRVSDFEAEPDPDIEADESALHQPSTLHRKP